MNTRLRVLVAGAAACTLLAATTAPAAATGTGSSHSAAAETSAGSGLDPAVATSGLVALLSSVLGGVVNPLLATLTAAPQQTLTHVVDGLTGAGLQADNESAQQARPASGYPTCSSGGWTGTNCYGPLTPAVSAGAVTLSTGAVQGYATGDSQGYVAAAHVADPNLTVLGISIGNLGVVDASASCGASACSTTQTLSGGSLLGGIALTVSNGTLLAEIGGTSVPATGVGISGAGLTGIATLGGNLLTLKLSLSLTQLLSGLGLSSVLGLLSGVVTTGTTVTLTVMIGPGSQSPAGSAAAWGLDVGVDLSADIKLSVLGLAGVEVTTGGGGAPDLLDLKLAYATAATGTNDGQTTQWIPPGLI